MIHRASTFVLTLVASAALVCPRAHAASSPAEAEPTERTETEPTESEPTAEAEAASDARRASLVIDTSDVGEEGPVVKRRVRERTDVALRAAGVLPARDEADARIHVDIDPLLGEDPGYRFELWVVREGVVVGERRRVECTLCTESEIVQRVELTVGEVLTLLETSEPEPEPEATPEPEAAPEPTPTKPNPEDMRKARMSGLGKAGVAVLVLGVAAAGTGAVLVALPPTVNEDDPLYETTTRPPGFAALGGGAAAIVAGAVMLAVDLKRAKASGAARPPKRARTTTLSPALAPGFTGLTWRGRF